MKRKIIALGVAVIACLTITGCGESSSKSSKGAGSDEKALQNYMKGFINGDVDLICNATAPEELWDYICDDSGLSRERLAYKLLGGEEEFNEIVEYLKAEDLKISDFKIEEKYEYDDDEIYTMFNRAMKFSGIEGTVDKIYEINSNDMDAITYEINGNWYCGDESMIEGIISIAYSGYDEWND